jgi:Ca-activated chloride channel family protein
VAPAFYLLAFAGLLVALARPKAEATVTIKKSSVMLLTDRSGSMAATDVGGSRIDAVKRASNLFLDKVPNSVQTGLMSFNHEVQLLQSPTLDHARLRTEIAELKPGGSTAAGDALASALSVLRPKNLPKGTKQVPASIILMSDGKSVRGQDPLPVARAAGKAGIKIYTIALGTPTGTLTSTKDGKTRTQAVPPDQSEMSQIAKLSGGEAFTAPTAEALSQAYAKLGATVAKRKQPKEITSEVAGASLLLLVAGAGASLVLFGRLP